MLLTFNSFHRPVIGWYQRLLLALCLFISLPILAQEPVSRPIVEGYQVGGTLFTSAMDATKEFCRIILSMSYSHYEDKEDLVRPPIRPYCLNDEGVVFGRSDDVIFWRKNCQPGDSFYPAEASHPQYIGGQCSVQSSDPLNTDQSCPTTGNPITLTLGEKIQSEQDIPHLQDSSIQFTRYYNSGSVHAPTENAIGQQWSHTYNRKIISGGYSLIQNASGGVHYWKSIDGRWIPFGGYHAGIWSDLSPEYAWVVRTDGKSLYHRNVNGRWVTDYGVSSQLQFLPNNEGWVFTTKNNVRETYDRAGRLILIEDTQGEIQTLSYELTAEQGGDDNPATLDRVEDSQGNYLAFTHNGQLISSITHSTLGVYEYQYNENNMLSQVIKPDSTARIYHYENESFPLKLTGITDERGVRYVSWGYDSSGKANRSEKANGLDRYLIDYNANHSQVMVTNPLGKDTTYHFQAMNGVRKLTRVEGHPTEHCAGANKHYQYDTRGFIVRTTDWNDRVTVYERNERGLETARTDAFGTPEARTITTEWHSQFNLPIRIVEPERETVMSYDGDGRLLSKEAQPRSF